MPERAPGDRVAGARRARSATSRKLRQPGSRFSAGTRTSCSSMSACQTARSAVLPVITVRVEARRALLDQVAADVAVLVARPDDHHVGDRRVADPALARRRARTRRRRGARCVSSWTASEPWSGSVSANAPICVEVGHRRQPALLLLLGAEHRDRLHREVGVHAEERADAAVRARPLHAHQARPRSRSCPGSRSPRSSPPASLQRRRSSAPARTGTPPAPSSR